MPKAEQMAGRSNGGATAMVDEDPFGHAALRHFLIDAETTYLNHGGFSCTPRPVLKAAEEWREAVEAQPGLFMRARLPGLLRDRAEHLGAYLNGHGQDIVFVENATAGINAVLRSLVLMPGDEILATNHLYGSLRKVLEFIAARAGARIVYADVPFPCAGPGEVLSAFAAGLSPRTRLAVLDHVTSHTALVFPLEALLPLAAERGVPVLIDGAHGPGQLPVDLDRLGALGATWYVANGHKWLGAPKGCAFIWTAPSFQGLLRPTSISEMIDEGYPGAFDWPGTKDFSPYLGLDAALTFRAGFGERQIELYCHSLVTEAASVLADVWETGQGGPPSMAGFMATVRLPTDAPATRANADRLRDAFLADHGLELVVIPVNGALWVRIGAYLYNEIADYRRAAEAGLAVCRG